MGEPSGLCLSALRDEEILLKEGGIGLEAEANANRIFVCRRWSSVRQKI